MARARHGGSGEVGATWALIAAAGSGERLGIDRPKAFAVLGGRPLLAESIDRLDRCELVDAIVVAAPPGWEEPSILLAEELAASKVVACVTGGPRARSRWRPRSARCPRRRSSCSSTTRRGRCSTRPCSSGCSLRSARVRRRGPGPAGRGHAEARARRSGRGDRRPRGPRRGADAAGVSRAGAPARLRRRPHGCDRLRVARRARGRGGSRSSTAIRGC